MATEKNISSRIINKHDTEVNWNKAINFIPKAGEIIVYDRDETYDYERFKIGDNVTSVINLPFYLENQLLTYTLSKNNNQIVLTGSDGSSTSIEENSTIVTDDNNGNVVLESVTGIAYMEESLKQELVEAVLASLTTETMTFTMDDGTIITKEVVIK